MHIHHMDTLHLSLSLLYPLSPPPSPSLSTSFPPSLSPSLSFSYMHTYICTHVCTHIHMPVWCSSMRIISYWKWRKSGNSDLRLIYIQRHLSTAGTLDFCTKLDGELCSCLELHKAKGFYPNSTMDMALCWNVTIQGRIWEMRNVERNIIQSTIRFLSWYNTKWRVRTHAL